jgi:NADH pyrophosphatase NudC (nudix superfamily)
MTFQSRARRVVVEDARAHLGDTIAKVVNVSRTGALVRAGTELRLGSQWPMTLELNAVVVRLIGRVVRLERSVGFAAGMVSPQFAIAFTFVEPSTDARSMLDDVCDGRHADVGVNLGFWRVSLVRFCPRCHSRSVSKAAPHRYACDDCHHFFHGFRIGPVRVARS